MSDFETELAEGQAVATSNGWQRIVAAVVMAVAPLAVTLALGTATAHADTYVERGGGSVQHRPGWENGPDLGARQDHVPVPRSWNSGEQDQWRAICGSCH